MRNATALSVLIGACLALTSVHVRADEVLGATAFKPAALDASTLEATPQNATVPDARANDAGSVDAVSASLKPGEFKWLGEDSGRGGLLTVVDLSRQRAIVYRNGQPIAVTTVSTGMPGRDTPTGVFPILAKEKVHHSNLYNDAPMPFMQRLTWDGIALHAGRVRDRPASHGCVRLPIVFAEQLFQLTSRGETVVIAQDDSAAALVAAGLPEWQASQVGRGGALDSAALALADHGGATGSNFAGAADAPQ